MEWKVYEVRVGFEVTRELYRNFWLDVDLLKVVKLRIYQGVRYRSKV